MQESPIEMRSREATLRRMKQALLRPNLCGREALALSAAVLELERKIRADRPRAWSV